MYKVLLFILNLVFCCANGTRISGWYLTNHQHINSQFPPEKLNWDIYTHIHTSSPYVYPNGTAICDKTDVVTPKIVALAHKHGSYVQWGLGLHNIHDALWNPNKSYLRTNYINSIGKATRDCNIDGIEVDYEWQDTNWVKIGIVTPKEALHYTQFLANIKKALGPNKIVSADISIWGVAPGNYVLGVLPWIDVDLLNNGAIDFVNTMSYHWNKDGDIWSWKKDAFFIDLWGIDRKRVNIGIPYYSENRTKKLKIFNEPTWGGLSPKCPNIDPDLNVCDNITFIGKKMNQRIGKFIKDEGFGGAFPWAANYDTLLYNNSLVEWLYRGMV